MTGIQTNSAIWDAVCTTDPKYTRPFNRAGFKGTATNITWLARQATRTFGPCGIGWGTKLLDERYQPGKDGDVIHIIRLQLWYVWHGQRGEIEQFGQTTFVGSNKNGAFTDEEAPKKSMSDAMSKCLSLLGFASDIHLGLYDDNKYADALTYGGSDGPAKDDRLSAEEHKRAETQAAVRDDHHLTGKAMAEEFRALTCREDVLTWAKCHWASFQTLPEPIRRKVWAVVVKTLEAIADIEITPNDVKAEIVRLAKEA